MAEELLSLKWNNHQSHFMDILTFLREQEIFVDVTLACGGKLYAAHKFVLSTCSEYFKQMFIKNAAKHPIVFMKDVTSRDLEALLDFMYNGEVNVPQSSLGSLIKTAEGLQIKGLAVPDDPPVGKRDKDSIRDKRERDYKSNIDSQSSPPPPKKPRPRDRSPPFTSSHVPVSHSPPRTARSPISHSTITTIKTQPIETNIDEDSRTSVQSAISGHSEQTSQNTSLKPNVNSSNQFNSDRPPSLSSSENPPIINPSSDEPSPGPSGMQHTSKEEEMEIKQEDVVDLGDDDEGDWGSGGGEDGLGGDSSIGSDHNASNFNDMMLPHGDAGGITGSEDTAMWKSVSSVRGLHEAMFGSFGGSPSVHANNRITGREHNHKQQVSSWQNLLPSQQYSDLDGYGLSQLGEVCGKMSSGQTWTCHVCNKLFGLKYYYERHMKCHKVEKDHQCPYCEFKATYKWNLKSHIRNKHKEQLPDD